MKTTKLVYLDTNVYCRPLDDQSDSRIHQEAEAFLQIIDKVERGKAEIVSSDYVKFEIEQIKDLSKRNNIQGFERILSKTNVTPSKRLISIAKEMNVKCRLNYLDALHSAAACLGKASFLLTCDDEILENTNCIETFAAKKGYRLKVRNPIDYLKENGECTKK
jgi:predicted nucleic acid-binding protein